MIVATALPRKAIISVYGNFCSGACRACVSWRVCHKVRRVLLSALATTPTRRVAFSVSFLAPYTSGRLPNMSEPTSDASDARRLFSPLRPADREPSTDAPAPGDTSMSSLDGSVKSKASHTTTIFVGVHVPTLSRSQMARYRSVAEDELESDAEFSQDGLERIVAEFRNGAESFYYVRYDDGVVYQVRALICCTTLVAMGNPRCLP